MDVLKDPLIIQSVASYFSVSVLTFLVLIATTIIFRVFKSEKYYRRVMALCVVMFPVYAFFIVQAGLEYFSFDFVVGYLSFLILANVYFLLFIGILKRSFSLNLLRAVLLVQPCGIEKLLQSYSDGRGVDFLKHNRLDAMTRNHLVKIEDGKFALLPKGYFLLGVRAFFIRYFRIRPVIQSK